MPGRPCFRYFGILVHTPVRGKVPCPGRGKQRRVFPTTALRTAEQKEMIRKMGMETG